MRLPRSLGVGLLLLSCASSAAGAQTAVPPQIVLMEGRGRQLVFLTEKRDQRFHVYEWKDGRAHLIETLPCTTGKATGDKRVEGDLKTPEGVYRFLRYIDGSQLPPLYGSGAFTMDYPNPFDLGDRKTGSGIWMHGVETNDRVHVARDTRGCVALANPEIERLRPAIRLHDTPIIVVESLETTSPDRVASDASAMRRFVESWRGAWESKDMDAYARHYAQSFAAERRDLAGWIRHKRELARAEGERRIGVDELTVLRERDRWWVSFRQEYATASHRDAGRKTLFIRGNGPSDWQIISEQWRSLDDRFRIIDPGEVAAPMSAELVAAIAPDAAAAAPVASRKPPPRPAAAPEPPRVVARAIPPATPESPGGEPAREAEPAATPLAPAGGQASPAPTPAAAAAAVPEPAPPARAAKLAARLENPTTNRRTFGLLGPHVQRVGESLLVQVQLLNLRPTSMRSGALILSLPEGAGMASTEQAEPFTVKQGRLISLSLPDAALPLRIGVLVRDEAGNVALEQELLVEDHASTMKESLP